MLALQSSPDWDTTAVIFAYDDSDGWYDHQAPPIVNPSSTPQDVLNGGAGVCNAGVQQKGAAPASPLNGAVLDRTGPLRLRDTRPAPRGLTVLQLTVDHTLTDQSSILKFVEDNWLGRRTHRGIVRCHRGLNRRYVVVLRLRDLRLTAPAV